ncbi:23S rRNA (uracil(1939)-C(5))-methyltransferase RlmD [bacterium]|nr:23S rRNA (uracil(1939)-C(5))-methyltransferase RlmD [bacterium]
MREELLEIEKLAFGGAGLGRVGGKVCFVPFTAPGDTVRVRITSEKKSYQEGTLLECLATSPDRTTPPCGVFGACGGCCWQHLPYDSQLKAKQEIFTEILSRGARVGPEVIKPILAAPSPYGYRSRVQLKVRSVGGELHAGFYRQGSHFVVDIPGICFIANELVNRIYGTLLPLLERFPEPRSVPQIDVATGDDGDALLLFHYIGEKPDEAAAWLEQTIPGAVPVSGVFLQSGRKATLRKVWGDERVTYSVPAGLVPGFQGMKLSFRCGGFSQVNYRQNLALIETVLAWAELTGSEKVLDLFCGNGNFSLPLAQYCAEVTGLEDFEQSIEDAVRSSVINGVSNVRFLCRDSAAGLKELADQGERFDVVILDPPRTGALEAVRLIPALEPEKVLYVSCDPPTLARDLAELAKHGYAVVASRAVDMFPQTYHIESVTLLCRT